MTYGSSVAQRLPIDLRVAANIMADTNTFPTGQGIMRDAATRIETLEELLKIAKGALGDIHDGEPEWPDDDKVELAWCRNRAFSALSKIKTRGVVPK
jgi:hypothetical protein